MPDLYDLRGAAQYSLTSKPFYLQHFLTGSGSKHCASRPPASSQFLLHAVIVHHETVSNVHHDISGPDEAHPLVGLY